MNCARSYSRRRVWRSRQSARTLARQTAPRRCLHALADSAPSRSRRDANSASIAARRYPRQLRRRRRHRPRAAAAPVPPRPSADAITSGRRCAFVSRRRAAHRVLGSNAGATWAPPRRRRRPASAALAQASTPAGIVARVKNILLSPRTEWPVIGAEPQDRRRNLAGLRRADGRIGDRRRRSA